MSILPTTHRDYEVEIKTTTGEVRIQEIGHSESPAEACQRVMSLYGEPATWRDWQAASVTVIRTIREHCPEATQIDDLEVSYGDPTPHGRAYYLTDFAGRPAYAEHGGGHIKTAFEFLTRSRPAAKWKTVKLLTTLRQAFREDSVNGHDGYIDELMSAGPVRSAVDAYLAGARVRDRAHHGENTF